MKWSCWIVISIYLVISSCKKDNALIQHDTDILSYSIQNKPAVVNITPTQKLINIRFPDSLMSGDSIIANFTLSQGAKASILNVEQITGVSINNYSNILNCVISNSGNTSNWIIVATNNNYTDSFGLGNFIQQTVSNNCSFSWYLDQAYTGPYSYDNCGPAAVSMVCKWSDSTFSKSVENARAAYRPTGGPWYPDDITFYLRDNNVPNSTFALPTTLEGNQQVIKRQIDLHQIVIVCLDMNLVRLNSNPNAHADRFYNTQVGVGHFIIVKGYKIIDNNLWYETYDPASITATYTDGILKGQDRYYRSEDIFEATKNWWPKIFLVAKKGAAVIE